QSSGRNHRQGQTGRSLAAHNMTARFRRGSRRRKPHSLSYRLAAIRGYRASHLGTLQVHLLGQDRVRKVVALALFLSHR
ncbi:MAG TPA: hypothetical protein VIE89_20970, partial [Candidatus Binatia bacterium]